jgi:asparagine synthetase B (glutamine-hydrolysing)
MKPTPKVRPLLLAAIADAVPETEVAVALSGGADSTAVLLAARELGKRITAYSFTLDDRASSDFAQARHNAGLLQIPFRPVLLTTSLSFLKADVRALVRDWGLRKKTAIECAWPYFSMLTNRKIEEPVLLTGAAADGHFGVSKKAMIHYRGSVEKLDGYRRSLFDDPDYAQTATVARIGEFCGRRVVAPFRDERIVAAFTGTDWWQINTPRQKEPIRASYPEFKRLDVMKKHTNLQLGDSGIALNFERLLADPSLNPGERFKSITGVYNLIAKGETP